MTNHLDEIETKIDELIALEKVHERSLADAARAEFEQRDMSPVELAVAQQVISNAAARLKTLQDVKQLFENER